MPINYYFISSPLHLMFAANMAIQHGNETNVAVINSYIPANFRLYVAAVAGNPQIFDKQVEFNVPEKSGKYKIRKYRMKVLKGALQKDIPDRIFTGSDRSVEFQYAMHIGKKLNPNLKGVYLDEGTQTYLGHKHMYDFQHRVIDPTMKKIIFGSWWKSAPMIGASGWIDTVYASFPSQVHELLKQKEVLPISLKPFGSAEFQQFADSVLEQQGFDSDTLSNVRCILVLTNDSYYKDFWSHFGKLLEALKPYFHDAEIAVKAHPRSKFLGELQVRYPGFLHLNNRIGMEFLLPKINEEAVFIGDVSSALFTIKWFRPTATVMAAEIDQDSPMHFEGPLKKLFNSAGIEIMRVSEIGQVLEQNPK